MHRLLACCVALAYCLSTPVASSAGSDVYTVSIDGRPLSDKPKDIGALDRYGVVYVDVVLMTRAFSGLLTFHQGGKVLMVSIEQHNATFTVGRGLGAPFIYNGDMFVPLIAFARFTRSTFTIDRKAHAVALATTRQPAPR